MKEHIGRILLSEDVILERVRQLGQQISKDYRDKEITIVCVLKGAVVFLADLMRNLDIPADFDFIQISSYGDDTESSGELNISRCSAYNIQGRHVLVVEDIVDSGLTLSRLKEILLAKRPASLKFCVFLDKDRAEDVELDYVGFRIPADEFVIGYGLDYAGKYRGLRYIATLEI